MNQATLLLHLAVALGLSSLIGIEREFRLKSAGLRTHTLVGLGAAVAMIVSKYGFFDVLDPGRVTLDPARVAAQIVSGVGFIGAGLIFLRGDLVRGLTTAAVVWLTAMIGMAAGAGLYLIAAAATLGHFLVVIGFPVLMRSIPNSRWAPHSVYVTYVDGKGVLRKALTQVTGLGFVVSELSVDRSGGPADEVTVAVHVVGKGSVAELADELGHIEGVIRVSAGDSNVASA